MPKTKNPLKFGRRKSAGNLLDLTPVESPSDAPASSSTFRVLQRPEKNIQSFDTSDGRSPSKLSPSRPFNSPLRALRGKSVDELALSSNRGSGGTQNSGSSGYYGYSSTSPRHSSSSTLPSSVDAEREDNEIFPVRKAPTAPMPSSAGANSDEAQPPTQSFTSRAVKALSFAQKNKSADKDVPPLPVEATNGTFKNMGGRQSPQRDRGLTASSYASTAVPSKPDNFSLGNTSFGLENDDFGSMFNTFGGNSSPKPESRPTPPPMVHHGSANGEPMFPPRTHSSQGIRPVPIARTSSRDDPSRFSFEGRTSHDGLVANGSATNSPNLMEDGTYHAASGIKPAFLASTKPGYSLVPESHSPGLDESFKKEWSYMNKHIRVGDDDNWNKNVELSNQPSQRSQYSNFHGQANEPARTGAASPDSDDEPLWGPGSKTATPRATIINRSGHPTRSQFDTSPAGPASRAVRPGAGAPNPKRMTKAQFDALQRRGDSSGDQSDEEEAPAEDDFDPDEDDMQRAKQAALQRRKQEANMSIYRQQMKKVTGGGPTDLPGARPSMDRAGSSSFSGLHMGGVGGAPPQESVRGKPLDDDDDDIPLGVLQAHGFPSVGRPPTRTGESDLAGQRRTSGAGSVVGGGGGQGNLPPFARRLPMDPYYGAGVVNNPTRESMAFGGGSVYGGGSPGGAQQGHPAGLVGVIAGEERAKAARRGSPNASTGQFGPPPPMPQTYMPGGMPGMPMMPQMPMFQGDPMQQQAQMQQFMQMQMQLMQNMFAMQNMGQQPQPMQQQGDFLNVPNGVNRPMSMAGSRAPSFAGGPPPQGRSMTMMHAPSQWDMNQGMQQRPMTQMGNGYAESTNGMNPGYTPSIAPSERSNVGMPSRYRPVQTNGDGRSMSMTSSMTLQALNQPQGHNPSSPMSPSADSPNGDRRSTIRVIEKTKGSPNVRQRAIDPDDDEDEGWADMAKKRSEKKFTWRRKDKKSGSPVQQPLAEIYHTYD